MSTGFIEAYGDRYGANVVGQREHAGASRMHRLDQPAGVYEVPTSGELVLSVALNGGFRARLDLGAGRYERRYWRARDFGVIAPRAGRSVFEVDGRLDALNLAIAAATCTEIIEGVGCNALEAWSDSLSSRSVGDDAISSAMLALWSECESGTSIQRLQMDCGVAFIVTRLLALSQRPVKPPSGGLAAWAERRCLEFLHARFDEDIPLAELAAMANLSPFHFARMFKTTTGLPPHAYQRRLRAERACELLQTSSLSIGDVATAVGYETPQAFARMFRAEIGSSPSAWRREVLA